MKDNEGVKSLEDQTIRSFIAIELSSEVRSGLHKIQAELKLHGHPFVKWVVAEGVHLTLKFLGNISMQKVTEITRVIEQASLEACTFRLTIGGLGVFPNLRRPRVLWVGVGGEVEKLVMLQQHIDQGLKPLGFAPETRPFAPHLTLARLREGIAADKLLEFGDMVARKSETGDYEMTVTSVSLMRSQLLSTGAVYSRLTNVELKG